jgi:hypothetical protein
VIIRKQYLYIFVIIVLGFLTQTTGYDLYHHTYAIINYANGDIGRTYHLSVLNFDIPRYILGYYFPALLYKIGIPSFFAVLLLFFFSSVVVFRSIDNGLNSRTIFYLILAYSSFRFSMLQWAFIFVIPLIMSNKDYILSSKMKFIFLFFSASFHPVGFVFSVLYSIIYLRSMSCVMASFLPIFLASSLI